MVERLAATVIPVLAGFVAGVTVTMSRTGLPEVTLAGVAWPVALNPVEVLPNEELCGLGVPTVKSAALLLENPPRMSAVVLLGAGASPAPRKQVAVPLTSAILPVVAEKFGAEAGTKSGVTGRGPGLAVPAAA